MNAAVTRYPALVQTLVTLLETRNPYNVDHCKLVAHYADAVAARAGLDAAARERLRHAAEMHTLGVLMQMEEKRPHQSLPITRLGMFTGRETTIHHREEEILRHILGHIDGLDECIPIIVQRHEWFDGTGSVFGLSGDGILPEARALAVADAFVDLATPKSHRDPMTIAEVLERVRRQAGTQFDPQYVTALEGAVSDEEGRFGATARARRFESSRCRHWLGLGNFYQKIAESDWALRCFLAAGRLARQIPDAELDMDATFGQFMVFCDTQQYDRAREVLNTARKQGEEREGPIRQRFLLMWGWLEWLTGREENGEQILEGLAQQCQETRDLPGMATVAAFQAAITLIRRGPDHPQHRRWLERFMELVSHHDLFDVVERHRSQTIPLFLSAIRLRIEHVVARSILTRMGEPCHESLLEELGTPGAFIERNKAATPAPVVVSPPVAAEGTPVRILLLGRCQLQANGQIVGEDDWPTQKAMKLFAFLAYRRTQLTSDTVLMDTFWPDSDEPRARNSLRNAVHQIRGVLKEVLGEGAHLERHRKSHTLVLQMPYELDTARLEDALRESSLMLSKNMFSEAAARLKEGLALYRGEFLEGAHDEWVLGIRTHLSEQHLRGLHLLARAHLGAKDAEAAEFVARRAIGYDDLREDLHGDLIEALTAQNRRGEALRHYQDTVALYKKEMGLLPSSLSAIYDRLLKELPA